MYLKVIYYRFSVSIQIDILIKISIKEMETNVAYTEIGIVKNLDIPFSPTNIDSHDISKMEF